jgi:hypothetical protein
MMSFRTIGGSVMVKGVAAVVFLVSMVITSTHDSEIKMDIKSDEEVIHEAASPEKLPDRFRRRDVEWRT